MMMISRRDLEYSFLNSLFRWDDNPFEEEDLILIIENFDYKNLLSSQERQLLFRAIKKIVTDTGKLPPVEVVDNFIQINAPKYYETLKAEIIEAMSHSACVSEILNKQVIPLLKKYSIIEQLKELGDEY